MVVGRTGADRHRRRGVQSNRLSPVASGVANGDPDQSDDALGEPGLVARGDQLGQAWSTVSSAHSGSSGRSRTARTIRSAEVGWACSPGL